MAVGASAVEEKAVDVGAKQEQHESRAWSNLPGAVLAAIAQRLPLACAWSARSVCRHWRSCYTAAVSHLTFRVRVPAGQWPSAELCAYLVSASIVLPYHASSDADVAAAAAQLLTALASLSPRLRALDIGFIRHLRHEPKLRKTFPSPTLASQVQLLPALTSLHTNNPGSDAVVRVQHDSARASEAPRMRLEHLTMLYCTHSMPKASRCFKMQLQQLTTLRSLVINLRGAFTQEEALGLAPLVHLTRLEVHSSTTSFLSARTLQLLSSLSCPLQHLVLGPCILNPTPTLLSMFGSLPALTTLGAWVKCASPVQLFSDDSMAVRCGQQDMSGLKGCSDLRLILEGYSEARAVGVCIGCLSGLHNLELVLRGMWQPGWEHLNQNQHHDGGWQQQQQQLLLPMQDGWAGGEAEASENTFLRPAEQLRGLPTHSEQPSSGAGSGRPQLTRLVVRDERPSAEEEQAMGAGAHEAAAAAAAAAEYLGQGGGQVALVAAGARRSGEYCTHTRVGGLFAEYTQVGHEPSPLHSLLALALGPGLTDLELALAPSMGRCLLDQLPATCPHLQRLSVKGCFQSVQRPKPQLGLTDCNSGGSSGLEPAAEATMAPSLSGGGINAGVHAGMEEMGQERPCLRQLRHLRELHLLYVPKHPYDQVYIDLTCLPTELSILELECCTLLCSPEPVATSSTATSTAIGVHTHDVGLLSDSTAARGSLRSHSGETPGHPSAPAAACQESSGFDGSRRCHSLACATSAQPLTALASLQRLALRQCTGDVGDCLSYISALNSLELARCHRLSMLLPVVQSSSSSSASPSMEGLGVDSNLPPPPAPGERRLPDGWLGLEVLECDGLQQLLGSFRHCCNELSRLRCLTVLCVRLKAPRSMVDEQEVWNTFLDAMPQGLRTLHLFLDSTAKVQRQYAPRSSSGSGAGTAMPAVSPAVLRVCSLTHLRELKLLGSGCDMTMATLHKLQQALPYTAVVVEEM